MLPCIDIKDLEVLLPSDIHDMKLTHPLEAIFQMDSHQIQFVIFCTEHIFKPASVKPWDDSQPK